jgi:phospholipid/cholesterol/gamma-HCH transport system substrate-binding protein
VSGKEVGTVKAVDFAGAQVEVTLEMSKDVQSLITTESIASIGSLSLLGEPIVDVKAAPAGTPLKDGESLKSAKPSKSMSDLTATASDGLEQVKGLVTDIRAGQGTLGKMVTDDALYRDLNQFVVSANAVTNSLNNGKGTIGELMRDPSSARALKASLENLQAATAKLTNSQSALARLLNDDAMGASVKAATANLERISAHLVSGDGTAGKLLTDQAVYDQLNSVTKRIDALIKNLNEGQGTAQQLLHDRQLYDNMNRTVTEMQGLLADIRRDPKKYLNVKVSIF